MKTRINLLAAIFSWVVLPVGGHVPPTGISHRFEVISVNEGLGQHDVSSIVQDSRGFIWIATYDGLHRYDGYDFRIFRYDAGDDSSLADNRILCVFEDSREHLWVATEGGGLSLFNHADENFTNFKLGENPADNSVYTICEDDDGILWCGAASGLFRVSFDAQGGFVPKKAGDDGVSPRNIRCVGFNDYGELFVGTTLGAYLLEKSADGDRYDRFSLLDGTDRMPIYSLYPYQRGAMWIGTGEGLLLYDGARKKTESIGFRGKYLGGVRGIVQDRDGNYYIGTDRQGVFVIDNASLTMRRMRFDDMEIVNSLLIKNLFIDKMQNLWIGTGNHGVGRVNLLAKPFGRAFTAPVDGGSHVRSFFKDSHGRIWLQIWREPLRVYEQNRPDGTYMLKGEIAHEGQIVAINEDRKGNVWLCTTRSILQAPGGNISGGLVDMLKKFPPPVGVIPSNTTFHNIKEDNLGNLWVGCWNGLLQIKHPGSADAQYRFHLKFDLPPGNLSFVQLYCEPDRPRIWGCSRDMGLIMIDLDERGDIVNRFRFHMDAPEGQRLNSNHVWAVAKGLDGRIWVGTDAGLNCIEAGNGSFSVENFKGIGRLDNDKIHAIVRDRKGDLWLSTSVGLLMFNPETRRLRQYFYSDGLSSSALTQNSQMDADGAIYLGSINGITYFHPEEIHDSEFVPQVAISSLSVFNRKVNVAEKVNGRVILDRSILDTKQITLAHNQNNFTLGFIGLHFDDPYRNLYAHKLEGYDREWIVSDGRNRTASYNNLYAGKYTFRVKAANSDGVWSDEETLLDIEIKAAPWATWWAFLLYAVLTGLVIYVIFRYYRSRQLLENQLRIQQLEHDHENAIHEARVKFHTNITHELRTPLTLIMAPLQDLLDRHYDDCYTEERLNLIRKNAERLSGLVNQFLDLSKLDKETMPLRVSETDIVGEIRILVDNFSLYASRKGVNLRMICETSCFIGWVDSEKITKIVMNLLSNALKFTPENGSVTVIVSQHEENLQIAVEDTGCGINGEDIGRIFDRFYQAKQNEASGTGIGLSLVQSLVKLHHGSITVTSREGEGSIFTVSIPAGKEAYQSDEIVTVPFDGLHGVSPETADDEAPANDKPIILVIEDDDDLRGYLKSCLSPMFEVLVENNAESGFEVALHYIPNLVITDVMLPGMTGFELSEKLKSDFRTSHIPIIILTAKDSDEDMLEGYRTGAENYITKPFKKDQLLLKVKNIVTYRMFSHNERRSVLTDTSPLNEREQKFIRRVTTIIHDNLDRTDYSVEEICREIGTSRMQLHRKLTALTGKTASEFIRDIRLAKAKELLETGNYNVSETIYQVGFKSNSHFTKSFKDAFGVTPSDFLKKRGH